MDQQSILIQPFLFKALDKIAVDCGKKYGKIASLCKDTADFIEKLLHFKASDAKSGADKPKEVTLTTAERDRLLNKIVDTLRVVCDAKNARLTGHALDCLHVCFPLWSLLTMQKLVAYESITGKVKDEDKPEQRLIDKVITIIANCFDQNPQTPEDHVVQLQMIRALLTAISSPVSEVHEASLMAAVKTCYNICLMSPDPTNQTTAKATLTQMLSITFSRFEQSGGADDADMADSEPSLAPKGKGEKSDRKISLDVGDPRLKRERSETTMDSAKTEAPHNGLPNGKSVEKPAAAAAVVVNAKPSTPAPVVAPAVMKSPDTPTPPVAWHFTPAEVGHEVVLDLIDRALPTPAAAPTTPRQTDKTSEATTTTTTSPDTPPASPAPSPAPSPASGAVASTPVPVASPAPSAPAASAPPSAPVTSPAPGTPTKAREAKPQNIYFNDCFSVFRALCLLSSKELPENISPDDLDMRLKILSLELMLGVLENSGPVLQGSMRFINGAIKKLLCNSILMNGVSPVPRVFQASLSLFCTLIAKFNQHLKNEIGLIFTDIVIFILETSTSTILQRWLVIQVLERIFKTPQTLVDIFLNYDSDLKGANIFEKLVNDISAIAKASFPLENSPAPNQEMAMRHLALECLVTIMQSLVDFSKELAAPAQTTQEEDNDAADGTEKLDSVAPTLARSQATAKPPDQFEINRIQKQQLAHGRALFNMKPKKGLQYLVDTHHIQNTPQDIGRFMFYNTDLLDKVKVGEWIGGRDEPNKQALYAYTDCFNFKGMEVDIALRQFLSYFRLPGEGKMVDRIIEKFGERYFKDNTGVSYFSSADAPYVLSFSIVMLATDLHSPNTVDKMKPDQWIKSNRLMPELKDFPDSYFHELYARIKAKRIQLRDEGFMEDAMRRDTKTIIAKLQTMMKDQTTFFHSAYIGHVKPMFEICWCAMIAAFSVVLEQAEESGSQINLCLQGFRCAIRVASIFYMETERNAFVSSLAKFTVLNNTREMRPKHIQCIKTLINIAETEGNFLQDSWIHVLRCISQLDRMHLVGRGGRAVDSSLSVGEIPSFTASGGHSKLQRTSDPTLEKDHEKKNAETIALHFDTAAIDRIFTNSISLTSNAIVDFVSALCRVSEEEISGNQPRGYSLQKLVEISYYNMDRIRFVWSSIWQVLGRHFVKVGRDKNTKIAMYAIDSLRQLLMKFLDKPELANYRFQKDFIKPFEALIHNNPSKEIRELIVRCLSQMVQARAVNIKSGWKSLFGVFLIAASDTDEGIVRLAFDTVSMIMRDYFQHICNGFFVECVNCLIAYGNNRHFVDFSYKAIESICFCAEQLAGGQIPISDVPFSPPSSPAPSTQFTDSEPHLRFWFPILTGLSCIISHPHIDVRNKALDNLFAMLRKYGHQFSPRLWGIIFRGVLQPIFDGVTSIADGGEAVEDTEWLTTTCLSALIQFVNLFGDFYWLIGFLVDEVFLLLATCVSSDNESLARIGGTCLMKVITDNIAKWTPEQWSAICIVWRHLVQHSVPSEVLQFEKLSASSLGQPNRLRSGTAQSANATPGAVPQVSSTDAVAPPTPRAKPEAKAVEADAFQRAPEDAVTKRLERALGGMETSKRSLDERLIELLSKERSSLDWRLVRGRCVVQLLLVSSITDLAEKHYDKLSLSNVESLLTTLDIAQQFAREANHSAALRRAAQTSGVLRLFVKQEVDSALGLLRFLLRLYAEGATDSKKEQLAESKLLAMIETLVSEMSEADKPENAQNPEAQLYAAAKVPVVQAALKGVAEFTPTQFARNLARLYTLLTDLIVSGTREQRMIVRELFVRLRGAMLSSAPSL